MNITVQLKIEGSKQRLFINGANIGVFSDKQLKDLVKRLDNLIHHKQIVKQEFKDHFLIKLRDIDLGDWEVSQVRYFIETVDKATV